MKPRTQQEVYDLAVDHMLTQNAKAMDEPGRCYYLDPATGRQCPVGRLIPKGHRALDQRMGAARLLWLHRDLLPHFGFTGTEPAIKKLFELDDLELDDDLAIPLLTDLQNVHDYSAVRHWPEELRIVAHAYTLKSDIVDQRS